MNNDEWFEHCRFVPLDQAVRYVEKGYIIEEENEENTNEE
jgi:hypothetical protein|tara:strand:- start:18 stop:137 length:120 start_codon:yes stop_codon:yes gene_type:complete